MRKGRGERGEGEYRRARKDGGGTIGKWKGDEGRKGKGGVRSPVRCVPDTCLHSPAPHRLSLLPPRPLSLSLDYYYSSCFPLLPASFFPFCCSIVGLLWFIVWLVMFEVRKYTCMPLDRQGEREGERWRERVRGGRQGRQAFPAFCLHVGVAMATCAGRRRRRRRRRHPSSRPSSSGRQMEPDSRRHRHSRLFCRRIIAET